MTSGLSENTVLSVTDQHRHKQPRPRSRRQFLQPRSNQYSQTFFDFAGCHYLVAGYQLSGWVEIFKTPHGTAQAGVQGLIAAIRTLLATFGVPEEISSDDGPVFSSAATANFLTRWEVRHRMSSVYFPQSNGRAEVTVKQANHRLTDNVGPTGSLNNDDLLCALFQARTTIDPDCNHQHRWYRPLSQRLDRCDRVIQDEVGDSNGGNV